MFNQDGNVEQSEIILNNVEIQLNCEKDEIIIVITDFNSLKNNDFEFSIEKEQIQELIDFLEEFKENCS